MRASLRLKHDKRFSATYVILFQEVATLRITDIYIYISAACFRHSKALLVHLQNTIGNEAPF